MKKYRVIEGRKATSENPIVLKKGDNIICLKESDSNGDWPNWILCRNHENEGWVPKQILDRKGKYGVVLEDYNAVEFNLEKDEVVLGDRELNGWIWGHKVDDANIMAWVPLNHIELIQD